MKHELKIKPNYLADATRQCGVMAELLRDIHEYIGASIPQTISEHYRGCDLLDRIDDLLAGQLPDPAVTVTETIRTAPERIWLQIGDQSHYHSEPFPNDTSEVSWCADSVIACEVPYVRADLAAPAVFQGGESCASEPPSSSKA